MTKRYKIHPSIGIARVGTSGEFYIGPEIPGTFAHAEDGHYRDATKRLRRQAARFWVFEYDDQQPNVAPHPIFAGEDEVQRIEWTVHLANKKAIWFQFDEIHGITGDESQGIPYPPGWPLRNQNWIPPSQPEERRRRLIINPGPRTLADRNQRIEIEKGNSSGFDETWPGPLVGGKEITSLGTMTTDDKGRLVVAGGFGTSGAAEQDAIPPDGRLASFVNNDKWFDDVSDGPVTARVIFSDGTSQEVTPSWLIVGPPDYAPPIENIVTVYDCLYDLALRELGLDPAIFDPATNQFQVAYAPSFTHEIYTILRRAFEYRWVIRQAQNHPSACRNLPH
jgi:L-lysine 6-oxidase